ncbi:MAG: TlpA disulfide reductase family protein [Ignavibacteriales bacterium]|nr:TlpA disulfide reductase family protein [Ignavibacteriales bacterium]
MRSKLTVIVLLVFFSSLTFAQDDINSTTLKNVGDNSPAFTTTSLNGNSFSSESLKNKVVLINFWATWCPPCKAELPLLQKNIYDRIKNANFAVLCISRGEKEEVVKKFIEQYKYTFPVYLDPDTKTYSQFATKYIPRNFVIGKDGKIKWASTGFAQKEFEKMIALIEEELKK